MDKKRSLLVSIFLISFAGLATEIILTRIFSVTLWYHSAFFVVSLAMFGLSLGGTYLFLLKNRISAVPPHKVLYATVLAIPASFLPILLIVPHISFSFSFGAKTYALITALFLVCQLPFFFIGFFLAYLFMQFSKESGIMYFFDLAGAGAGALFSVAFINYLGPINSLILLGTMTSVALLLNAGRKKTAIALTVFIGFIFLLQGNCRSNAISIARAKGKIMNNLYAKWNSFSMVRVFGNETNLIPEQFGWGMSPAYHGPYPPKLNMQIDADAYTPITRFDGDLTKVDFLKYDVSSFAYHLSPFSHVVVIGPGGGRDILTALLFGSKKITGVEVNPIITNDVMKKRFKGYSGGLYCLTNVDVVTDDARSYIRNSKDRYDCIQASLVDTWAASNAGAYSLSENNLYTVEAIAEYIGHLTENGYLTVSRWDSPADARKLTIIFLKACEKLSVNDCRKHLVLIKGDHIVNVIFKRSPFTGPELTTIARLAEAMKFEILYLPGTRHVNGYAGLIEAPDLAAFLNAPQNRALRPSTDDSPFFFNKVPFRSVPQVLTGAILDGGVFLLYGLFIISSLLSVLLIVVPVIINKKELFKGDTQNKLLYAGYFSLLGLGFILTEIAFMQKFILFLGHPVYSIIVVLFSLLVAAGAGSSLTAKLMDTELRSAVRTALLAVMAILLCYNLSLYPLFEKLLGIGITFRILVSVLLLIIMGIVMGMPFPIGIRLAGAGYRNMIPLYWSLNGIFTVLGSIVAVILAMNIGFTKTINLAICLYSAAFIIIGLTCKPSNT
ncbi:MAG: hypothetical protein PHS37_01155 [Candidatus Omnitrophica bacterium]|nr:hypothetical protein [Candidatus Omnitrophota bacterium]